MEVLFIRHGQTKANAAHLHQRPDEPLSPQGIAEVKAIIPQIQVWQPTHILTSPLARASYTARLISKEIDVEVVKRDELRELRRPLYVYDRKHYHPVTLWYVVRWFFNAYLHQSDVRNGESYQSFRKRLERVRSMLEQYPADARILVVSHSIFINFFVFHVCNDGPLTFWQAIPRFFKVFTHKNGKKTYLHFSKKKPGLCTWNTTPPSVSTQDA